ncbi:unnamed protein product [Symbiodinium natans]|uniref:Uncharacterized protein n=1 Tax=Symbiodinium natans TaxID=878477 RepID=A0A812P728_9DINO|nr:unnamed protein product [Symbiodinium natans]
MVHPEGHCSYGPCGRICLYGVLRSNGGRSPTGLLLVWGARLPPTVQHVFLGIATDVPFIQCAAASDVEGVRVRNRHQLHLGEGPRNLGGRCCLCCIFSGCQCAEVRKGLSKKHAQKHARSNVGNLRRCGRHGFAASW